MKHLVCLSRSFFVAILIGSATAVSCSKGELVLDDNVTAGGSISPQEEKLATDLELSALVSGSSYANGRYRVADMYKNAYVHVVQKTGECSWTNYVLAAASVIRAHGDYNYPDKAGGYESKIQHCKDWCGTTAMSKINSYVTEVDGKSYNISTKHHFTPDRNYTKAAEIMLAHLQNNQTPLIYITSVNRIGHYVIIWSIDWYGSIENSTVWYTDTLKSGKEFYPINFKELLRLNVNNNHNILTFYPYKQ